MKDPNERQVAGDHYRAKFQHWDFVAHNNLDYFIGQATKYVSRAHKKHETPTDDLNKAIHFIEKLQDLVAKGQRVRRPTGDLTLEVDEVDGFNDCSMTQKAIIRILATWRTQEDLEEAKALIRTRIPPAVAPFPL